MNKQVLFGVVDPFVLGYRYGQQDKRVWTVREAEEKIAFTDSRQTDQFLNGMEDGKAGDWFRLDALKELP